MMWFGDPFPTFTFIMPLFFLALCIVLMLLLFNRRITSRLNSCPRVQYDLYEENMLLKKQVQELQLDLHLLHSKADKPNPNTAGNY